LYLPILGLILSFLSIIVGQLPTQYKNFISSQYKEAYNFYNTYLYFLHGKMNFNFCVFKIFSIKLIDTRVIQIIVNKIHNRLHLSYYLLHEISYTYNIVLI